MQNTKTCSTLGLKHLDHLNLTVTDLEETIHWYGRIFDFVAVERGVSNGVPYAIIRAGDALLCIYERPDFQHIDRFGRAERGLHGISHFALRITDREAWQARVAAQNVEIHYGGAVEHPHSTAWYVNDPTGYEIEVAFWHDDTVRFTTHHA